MDALFKRKRRFPNAELFPSHLPSDDPVAVVSEGGRGFWCFESTLEQLDPESLCEEDDKVVVTEGQAVLFEENVGNVVKIHKDSSVTLQMDGGDTKVAKSCEFDIQFARSF